jgi:hypothetical protein
MEKKNQLVLQMKMDRMKEKEMKECQKRYFYVDEFTSAMETGFMRDSIFHSLRRNFLISLKKWESLKLSPEIMWLKI